MFTGIIEELGTVKKIEKNNGNKLTIDASFTPELKIDQSIAHNGVCLTVVSVKIMNTMSLQSKRLLKKQILAILTLEIRLT